jgi:hypothetical protein
VRQFTVAAPGRYRFSAEVASVNLTTDQCPFFRIFDPANPGRLNVETGAIGGTVKSLLTGAARADLSVGDHQRKLERNHS